MSARVVAHGAQGVSPNFFDAAVVLQAFRDGGRPRGANVVAK